MIKSDTPSKYGTYDDEVDARELAEAEWYERAVYWKRMFERNNTGQQEKMQFPSAPEPVQYVSSIEEIYGIKIKVDDYAVVSKLIQIDQFINAIKHVRQVTGLGLKEAKDFCDKLRDALGVSPNIPTPPWGKPDVPEKYQKWAPPY